MCAGTLETREVCIDVYWRSINSWWHCRIHNVYVMFFEKTNNNNDVFLFFYVLNTVEGVSYHVQWNSLMTNFHSRKLSVWWNVFWEPRASLFIFYYYICFSLSITLFSSTVTYKYKYTCEWTSPECVRSLKLYHIYNPSASTMFSLITQP